MTARPAATTTNRLQTVGATLRHSWGRMQPRERRLVALALAVVALALLWTLAVGPAWRTLRQAPAQMAELQAQLQHMQDLQRQARALAEQTPIAPEQAQQALRQATEQRLGEQAQLSIQGQQAQIRLQQVAADRLAAWLADSRANAHSRPIQAQLERAAGDAATSPALWNGTLTLQLP